MNLISQFIASPVMQDSFIPAFLIALVASSMSIMVLAHRLSFLTVGVSHASMAGLGLAVALALPLLPTATLLAVGIALLLAVLPKRKGITEDTGTGLLFAGSMALGIILISKASRQEVDLFGLLFGNILTITSSEQHWLLLVGSVIFLIFMLFARSWWSIAFDEVTASAQGMRTGGLRLLLYGTVGLSVIMCVKLAGIVLTTGLLVLPAACAWFWGKSLRTLWLYSISFAFIGTALGLLLSYVKDWPSGATVVMVLCILFLISWGASWLKQHHNK